MSVPASTAGAPETVVCLDEKCPSRVLNRRDSVITEAGVPEISSTTPSCCQAESAQDWARITDHRG